MDENQKPHFWHALTPAGVAKFAPASLSRLWLAQLGGALIVAASVIWFCVHNLSPIISTAILQLSENTQFSSGKLKNASPGLFADSKFLSISVTGNGIEQAGVGDMQVVFNESSWKICSVLGCLELPYPAETISVARSQIEPWWGAWRPVIFVSVGALVVVFLFFTWWVVSWIYCWLPKLLSFFLDRKLSWKESRRLCGAAQVSGAIVAAICIVLYGLAVFDLAHFLFFFSAHLLVDWIYIFAAPFFLRRSSPSPTATNPFSTAEKL